MNTDRVERVNLSLTVEQIFHVNRGNGYNIKTVYATEEKSDAAITPRKNTILHKMVRKHYRRASVNLNF